MTVRYYSSTATEKTLSGSINAVANTMTVSDTVGLPVTFPYTLAVDYDSISEELVDVTNAAGLLLTITRGVDGTSATLHNAGARVRHTSSARDFADSRNHENSDDGIHGLAPGEEIVGTDKVQTLTNKTVVDLQGSLLNPDINLTGANVITTTRTPAGAGTSTALEMVNGTDQTFVLQNDGDIRIRNTAAMDALSTTRRIQVVMSDGTTERFYVDTSGMTVSAPRAGTAATQGSLKMIDPGDDVNRKMIVLRNTPDALDKFVVRASGATEIINDDSGANVLLLQGAAGQSVNYLTIQTAAGPDLVTVGSSGELNANAGLDVDSSGAGNVVVQVKGALTQTASLQTWELSDGTDVARIRANGEGDFTASVATSGIITVVGGWSISDQRAIVKAGIATVNLQIQRTGAALVSSGSGIFPDTQIGTVNAAYRPHTGFGAFNLAFEATTGVGDGSVRLAADTGDFTLTTWSSGGTLQNPDTLTITMTYPLAFS